MIKRKEGFSLVELIIVIAILAILIGIVALAVLPYLEKSKKSVCLQERDVLQKDFTSKMVESIMKGSKDYDAVVKDVMTDRGLTDEGSGKYSGMCKSDGVYTVTVDADTLQIKDIVCSVHGSLYGDLRVSSNQEDYLKEMQTVFSDYMLDAVNAAKVGSKYTWDNNGTLYTPEILTALKKQLAEDNLKISDTAMWKIMYDKNKGYMLYWFDNGTKITQPGNGIGTGKKMYVKTDGTKVVSDFNCIIENKTVNRGNGNIEKYLAISNGSWS